MIRASATSPVHNNIIINVIEVPHFAHGRRKIENDGTALGQVYTSQIMLGIGCLHACGIGMQVS